MAFIETTPPADASGETLAMYSRQQGKYGYVPNYAKVFCHRPDIMALWADLLAGIRSHIAPREFELATLAAAHALKNSACSLAHGTALMKFFSLDEVIALVTDTEAAGIAPADRAIVRFARKVALDASAITQQDIDDLRGHGFDDGAIFDMAASAAARCFFAKMLDAMGVQPDSSAMAGDERFRNVMTVGRAISDHQPEAVPST